MAAKKAQRPSQRAARPEKRAARPATRAARPAKKANAKPPAEPADAAEVESKLPGWLVPLLERARERGRIKAGVVAAKLPNRSTRELGEELVRASALRAGWLGAATGTLALITLPVGLPAGVAATLFIEAELLFALLALYKLDAAGDVGRVRLAALWAGAGFADAAKSAGMKLTANAFGRVLAGSLPARLISRLEPALLRAILKRLGLGFVPRLFKLWPLIGAPIAFAIDRAALRALGKSSLDTLDNLEKPEEA